MKAIVLKELGGPEKLLWEEVSDPVPGAGQVLVRLKSAALNHRDAWIRKGLYAGIQLPSILGSDGSGEVAAVGPGVSTDLPGQAVLINPCLDWGPEIKAQGPGMRILGMPDNGTYAQMVVVPASNIRPKPAHLSFEEAAALPLAGMTAYRTLVTRARVTAGETVLVTGVGGGVASLALQIAHCLGARTFVTSGSDHKIERASALGAVGGVNYRDEHWGRKLRQLLQGRPLDVIIDGSGRQRLRKSAGPDRARRKNRHLRRYPGRRPADRGEADFLEAGDGDGVHHGQPPGIRCPGPTLLGARFTPAD